MHVLQLYDVTPRGLKDPALSSCSAVLCAAWRRATGAAVVFKMNGALCWFGRLQTSSSSSPRKLDAFRIEVNKVFQEYTDFGLETRASRPSACAREGRGHRPRTV